MQETVCELVMSILGAWGGGVAGYFLLWPIVMQFNPDRGVHVHAYSIMFLAMPAGSLIGMSLVGIVVRRSHQCTWRALIFTLVACDLGLALTHLIVREPEHPVLIASVFAFLGYKTSGLRTTRSRS